MAGKYVMGVDFGTTGTKAVIFDLQGNEIGSSNYPTTTRYPRPGWVAQDASEVVEKTFQAVKSAIEETNVNPDDIGGVAFTHICTSFVPVDKDGNYLHHILLWNDLRGAEMFPYIRECWEKAGLTAKEEYDITGFPLGTLPTLSKILWFRKHHPELWEKTTKIVEMHALLTSAFTDGEVYVDPEADIPYTKVANVDTFQFDPKLAAMYDLDISLYTERAESGSYVGKVPDSVAQKTGLRAGTPLFMGACDQRCACLGSGVTQDGMMSLCIGTAGVAHAYSSESVRHKDGKIQIMGHCIPKKWQIEANMSSASSSIDWAAQQFCGLEKAYASEMGTSVWDSITYQASQSPVGSNGVMYSAWMQGADCPRYNYDARGTFTGLTFAHSKNDMLRAVLEGVSLEIYGMLQGIEETVGREADTVRLTGGGAKSDFWNQIHADVFNKKTETLENPEATSLGAAICAAVGLGEYDSFQEAAANMVKVHKRFEPIPENVKVYAEMLDMYNDLFDSLTDSFFPKLNKFQSRG